MTITSSNNIWEKIFLLKTLVILILTPITRCLMTKVLKIKLLSNYMEEWTFMRTTILQRDDTITRIATNMVTSQKDVTFIAMNIITITNITINMIMMENMTSNINTATLDNTNIFIEKKY